MFNKCDVFAFHILLTWNQVIGYKDLTLKGKTTSVEAYGEKYMINYLKYILVQKIVMITKYQNLNCIL